MLAPQLHAHQCLRVRQCKGKHGHPLRAARLRYGFDHLRSRGCHTTHPETSATSESAGKLWRLPTAAVTSGIGGGAAARRRFTGDAIALRMRHPRLSQRGPLRGWCSPGPSIESSLAHPWPRSCNTRRLTCLVAVLRQAAARATESFSFSLRSTWAVFVIHSFHAVKQGLYCRQPTVTSRRHTHQQYP